MPLGFLGNLFGSAIAAQASYANTKQTNEANLKIARETNAANREMVEMQNKAAAAESEKAYQRSKASNQVGLMMSAGMSRAGAINALNGGGSYTPAPVNTSQDSAPQMQTADLSALANIGQGLEAISQRKHDEKMAKMQIAAQKEENAANRKNAKEIAEISASASRYSADSSSATARERLQFDREVFKENLPKLRAEIVQIQQNTKVLKTVEDGNNLDNIRKEFENKNMPEVAKLANAKGWQEIQYLAQRMAHENADAMNKQERETLELEFYRATMDSNINLTNLQNELQYYLGSQELSMYRDSVVGGFIGALCFCMDNLVPKFAVLK